MLGNEIRDSSEGSCNLQFNKQTSLNWLHVSTGNSNGMIRQQNVTYIHGVAAFM